MNALARLQAEGLRVRIGPAGNLQAAPAARLTPDLRALIATHAAELRAALEVHRAWRVTLTDGTRLIAVRPEGCARAEMLATVREQFGAGRVAGVESLERGTQHA
jgi:hypothetical protein